MTTPQRPRLQDITEDDIACIEAAFTPAWPDAWKDMARSFYITLVHIRLPPPFAAEELAQSLVQGVANDLGGTQPYLPVNLPDDHQKRSAVWLEFAASFATTLAQTTMPAPEAAAVVEHLVQGAVQDLGGTQPYIPIGAAQGSLDRRAQVLELLAQGLSYKQVANASGMTTTGVRKIESSERKERRRLKAAAEGSFLQLQAAGASQ